MGATCLAARPNPDGRYLRRLPAIGCDRTANHSATLNADWLPGDTPLRALCPRMVCTACGLIGADERGRLIPANDPEALASAVTALIENPTSALQIARNARAHVESHTWPRVRGAWSATYQRDGAAAVGDNEESVCV